VVATTLFKALIVTGSDANGTILAYAGTSGSYNQAVGNYVHDLITPCDSYSGTAIETAAAITTTASPTMT
jgi:hypothetical protein